MRGEVRGWAYNGAFNYSRSNVDQRATDGFVLESALMPIVNSGAVNPFGTNSQSTIDLMSTAKINGSLRTGTSSTTSLDFLATTEVFALPAGPVSVAIGASARRQEIAQNSTLALESGDVLNLDTSPSWSGARNIGSLFAEASIPLASTLEANVAVRYDHYSDFGGTTNPQVSLRWQPIPTLMLRASTGTGFFAPSPDRTVHTTHLWPYARQSERPGTLSGHQVSARLQHAIPAAWRRQPGAAADDVQTVERRRCLGAHKGALAGA